MKYVIIGLLGFLSMNVYSQTTNPTEKDEIIESAKMADENFSTIAQKDSTQKDATAISSATSAIITSDIIKEKMVDTTVAPEVADSVKQPVEQQKMVLVESVPKDSSFLKQESSIDTTAAVKKMVELPKANVEIEDNSAETSAISSKSHTYNKHNVGLGAGFTPGLGLTYKHWFESGYGYKVSLIPIFQSNSSYEDGVSSFLSLGVTGLSSVNESKHTNTFLYGGGSLLFSDYLFNDDKGFFMAHVGGGAGIEIHIFKIVLEVSTGLLFWYENERVTDYNYVSNSDSWDYIYIGDVNTFGIHPDISATITFGFGDYK